MKHIIRVSDSKLYLLQGNSNSPTFFMCNSFFFFFFFFQNFSQGCDVKCVNVSGFDDATALAGDAGKNNDLILNAHSVNISWDSILF
jgi:hypothetical protein